MTVTEPTAKEVDPVNLYLLEQEENGDYDTFDSIVVCAKSAEEARKIHPRGNWFFKHSEWCSSPSAVVCTLLGKADKSVVPGIVHTSYRAG
jgi:hypothetical protein